MPDQPAARQRPRDGEYLDWLRTLPCAACGRQPAEAHHLKGDPEMARCGVSLRASDFLAMPLCRACHSDLHDHFDDMRKTRQRTWLLRTLIKALETGIMTRGPWEWP